MTSHTATALQRAHALRNPEEYKIGGITNSNSSVFLHVFPAFLHAAERSRALENSIWSGSSYTVDDLLAIDKEGRCVITDHGASSLLFMPEAEPALLFMPVAEPVMTHH